MSSSTSILIPELLFSGVVKDRRFEGGSRRVGAPPDLATKNRFRQNRRIGPNGARGISVGVIAAVAAATDGGGGVIALVAVVGELDGGVTEGQQGSQTPQDECGRNNPFVGVVIVGGGGVAVAMLVLMLVLALVMVSIGVGVGVQECDLLDGPDDE